MVHYTVGAGTMQCTRTARLVNTVFYLFFSKLLFCAQRGKEYKTSFPMFISSNEINNSYILNENGSTGFVFPSTKL